VDKFQSEIRIPNVYSNFKTEVQKFELCLTSLVRMDVSLFRGCLRLSWKLFCLWRRHCFIVQVFSRRSSAVARSDHFRCILSPDLAHDEMIQDADLSSLCISRRPDWSPAQQQLGWCWDVCRLDVLSSIMARSCRWRSRHTSTLRSSIASFTIHRWPSLLNASADCLHWAQLPLIHGTCLENVLSQWGQCVELTSWVKRSNVLVKV